MTKCDLDLGTRSRDTLLNFATHRRIEHCGIIAEQTGTVAAATIFREYSVEQSQIKFLIPIVQIRAEIAQAPPCRTQPADMLSP